ncbi:MAG TPA: hypothetical protein VN765_11715 [Candidatus Acidoferrum sp.]|nr:hypothetical protein [Candidatus Acidoferrum sp.]
MKTQRTSKRGKRTPATGKPARYPAHDAGEPLLLKEAAPAYKLEEPPMIRTQIYLSRPEHEFIQSQAARQAQPMAAIIRSLIDEKMDIPESAWTDNPLLAPPADPGFVGPADGAINHDHYLYGGPKKWVKRRGQWVEAPPLPEDYHANPASAAAHDRKVEEER